MYMYVYVYICIYCYTAAVGILNIDGYDEQFVVQGVHMLFDGCKGQKWNENKDSNNNNNNNNKTTTNPVVINRCSKLVFIGINLNYYELHTEFLNCRKKIISTYKKT